jgi:hypothetical protein
MDELKKNIKRFMNEIDFHVEKCKQPSVLLRTLSYIDTGALVKNIEYEDLSFEFQLTNWIKKTPVFTEFNHLNFSMPHMRDFILNVS